jgi:hypothetical protein
MHVADHAALDAGKSANNQLFWEGMQEAFNMKFMTIYILQMMRF